MAKLKLHEIESLSESNDFDRLAVPGGWLYRVWDSSYESGHSSLCFVPSPKAPHARDTRRLKLREGWTLKRNEITTFWMPQGKSEMECGITLSLHAAWYVAYHADKSFTQHTTLLEAHDSLIASGSESPFEVVTGSAKGVAS
jgi:hypothetical protein